MENKDPIKIEPCEFVSRPDDVYNPLIGGWERQQERFLGRGIIAAFLILALLTLTGVYLWM